MTTPTHVFGQGAREYALSHGWTATTIIEGESLNVAAGAKGDTPETARHIVVTPGHYRDVKLGLGKRRYITLEGAPEARPCFEDTQDDPDVSVISVSGLRDFTVRHLELKNVPVSGGVPAKDGPCTVTFEDNYQHSWLRDRNGFACGNEDMRQPLAITYRRNRLDGVGWGSNLRHTLYVGSRAHSSLDAYENIFIGARGCSQLKTKCNTNTIRRNAFLSKSTALDDEGRPYTAHSMIDMVACTQAVISGNEFLCWKGDRSQIPAARNGIRTPPIFLRLRTSLDGSDIPGYPRQLFYPDYLQNPAQLAQVNVVSPGAGWAPGPETWMDPDFWADVAAHELADPANPFAFQVYVSGNTFRYEDGSQPMPALRDDGTLPVAEYAQGSGKGVRVPVPVPWRELSVAFLCDNTYDGGAFLPPILDAEPNIAETCPGYLVRSEPYHYPQAIEVPLVVPPPQVPDWFKV